MRRGVFSIKKHELILLLGIINWEIIPQLVSDKLKIKIPEQIEIVNIFLSEEDIEVILDSIDCSILSETDPAMEAYHKLQSFLFVLKNK